MLEAALRLQAQSCRVVVVGGASPGVDRVWLTSAREQLAPYRDRLEISYPAENGELRMNRKKVVLVNASKPFPNLAFLI